eukprot:TRINITY_DN4620_c1_g1_i1.p1 TRINITY_DN4620_c1_g1~~TRINITY_DN4620_c1_g1_i1.p1  ORF type:complete len:3251 (+),score=438.35 TRINITY_DN4620_c1_g1_i1:210-9962(+)
MDRDDAEVDSLPTKPPFKAYVENVPYQSTHQELRSFFESQETKVKNVVITRDGFAFVEFETQEALSQALQLNRQEFKPGRFLKIEVSRDFTDAEGKQETKAVADWKSGRKVESLLSNKPVDYLLLSQHVVLPRRLPHSTEAGFEQEELNLLHLLSSACSHFEKLCPRTFKTITDWEEVQPELNAPQVNEYIKNLQVGASAAFYLRAQNAGLMFTTIDEEYALAYAFPASAPNDVIYAKKELFVNYPTAAVRFKRSHILNSMIFAKQICHLAITQIAEAMPTSSKGGTKFVEQRNVAEPKFVTEYLLGTLLDELSEEPTSEELISVVKKVKDVVMWNNSLEPFRRSGLYHTGKIVLHLSLVNEFGESRETADFVYKMIMLELVSDLVQRFPAEMDYRAQIINKLVVRLIKLDDFVISKGEKLKSNHVETFERLKAHVEKIVARLYEKSREEWRRCTQNLGRLNFELSAIDDQFRQLSRSIFNAEAKKKEGKSNTMIKPQCPPRYEAGTVLKSRQNEEEDGIMLYGFEEWVIKNLDAKEIQTLGYKRIKEMFTGYITIGQEYYKEDAVGGSRMILVLLIILLMIDSQTITLYPVLGQHRTSVNTRIMQDLLLKKQEEQQLLCKIEKYFNQRNSCAYPSLIEEDNPTHQSFPVRASQQESELSRSMSDKLKRWLQTIEQEKQSKEIEFQDKKERCQRLKAQSDNMKEHGKWINRRGITVHDRYCQKCRLYSEASNMTMAFYEEELPQSKVAQLAIVFEHVIPEEIACYRDMLFSFTREVMHQITMKKNSKVYYEWRNAFKGSSKSSSALFSLSSTVKSTTSSHYKQSQLKILSAYSAAEYIVTCGKNTKYTSSSSVFETNSGTNVLPDKAKRFCTFDVSSDPVYGKLQCYLDDSKHSQNEVLGKQILCPQALSLTEWLEFGSLRAGERLQLRNMYRVMEQNSLLMKDTAVYYLFCQALWQSGERDDEFADECGIRKGYGDLYDEDFTEQFLEVLSKQVRTHAQNWKDSCVLVIIIEIAARICRYAKENKSQGLEVLKQCRKVATSWILQIKETLRKMLINKTVPKDEERKLKMRMVQAACCTILTFSVRESKNFSSNEDVMIWLNAMIVIHENVSLDFGTNNGMSLSFDKNLLRRVREVGMDIEEDLHGQVDGEILDQFILSHWSDAKTGITGQWKRHKSPHGQVYETVFHPNEKEKFPLLLQVDVLLGNFLVQGANVGRLPTQVTKHSHFQEAFGGTIVFDCQPSAEIGTYITANEFHGSKFQFLYDSGNDELRIKQITGTSKYLFVSAGKFTGYVPYLLQEEYNHWWNVAVGEVEFRKRQFSEAEFCTEPTFVLDLSNLKITEMATGRKVVNTNTKIFDEVSFIVKRLEHPNYMVLYKIGEYHLTMELPRMGLTFEVCPQRDDVNGRQMYDILSKEYNMKVCADQNLGTLHGLEQGLLLVPMIRYSPYDVEQLLIPHGQVHVSSGYPHQRVTIDNKQLKDEPKYFKFTVEPRLGRISAGQSKSGWLFLAYLHGVTSSAMVDSFSGLTGTESAFQILQSGNAWSCRPYDNVSQSILRKIGKLSPKREYYPPHLQEMQKVTWPEGLPSLAAHDGYYFISKKLEEDSKRLSFLYTSGLKGKNGSSAKKDEEEEVEEYMSNRAALAKMEYSRCEKFYSPQARISNAFDTRFSKKIKLMNRRTEHPFMKATDELRLQDVRLISHLTSTWTSQAKKRIDMATFLIQGQDVLSGIQGKNLESYVMSWWDQNFVQYWFDLYNYAIHIGDNKKRRCKWRMYLCLQAYRGMPMDVILLLQQVAVAASGKIMVIPPNIKQYEPPHSSTFQYGEVKEILTDGIIDFNEYRSLGLGTPQTRLETDDSYLERKSREFQSEVESSLNNIVAKISKASEEGVVLSSIDSPECIHINSLIVDQIKRKLKLWNEHKQLERFIASLSRLTEVDRYESTIKPLAYSSNETVGLNHKPFSCDFAKYMDETSNVDLYAQKIYQSGTAIGVYDDKGKEIDCTRLDKIMWKSIEDRMSPYGCKVLKYSSLYPRITPATIISSLVDANTFLGDCGDTRINQSIKKEIVALLLIWIEVAKMVRCTRYREAGEAMRSALRREEENKGHEGWQAEKYPVEWLIFELEQNLNIRAIQGEVAEHMVHPRNESNSLLQLNMGEGKTAVITPLLALVLGNGKQVCRITVLKSLYRMNLDALGYKLGSLLNRRVYTLPCRRDMVIGKTEAKIMMEVYNECKRKRGVVITVPEYRLSFQLKAYEKCRSGGESVKDAQKLLECQKWVDENVRDVLDESDEILHVKYQLIYTVGAQLPVSGGEWRWYCCQSVLRAIKNIAGDIVKQCGKDAIEFDAVTAQSKDKQESFMHFRILNSERCYNSLCSSIARYIIDSKCSILKVPELSAVEKIIMEKFLVSPTLSKQEYDQAMNTLTHGIESDSSVYYKDIFLTLRGILSHEVLALALSKRWRVNYGVNPSLYRLMAVPFRAKDVAAERTEFGHPDVAIMFTQLTYYYQGLTDVQIDQCFHRLEKMRDATERYAHWISIVDKSRLDNSVKRYTGINLYDYIQKTQYLYPVLRRNINVIDFWLNQFVFPKESKVFEGKLTASAWDLCPQQSSVNHKQPLVTGFSGTNGSVALLPLSIQQNDLPKLSRTNEEVKKVLLLAQNNNYNHLESGDTATTILEKVVKSKASPTVILDVGALMLELSNEQTAKLWLSKCRDTIKGAVYFDGNDRLLVRDRDNRVSELESSPFKDRIQECIFFLDDIHTRGTDLKIPYGARACVTLGHGLTKDKLVQACMRMRMLSSGGHTLEFWSSHEVHNKILAMKEEEKKEKEKEKEEKEKKESRVEVEDVINWAQSNTKELIEEGMMHWSKQGLDYTLRQGTFNTFIDRSNENKTALSDQKLIEFGKAITDSEICTLDALYGGARVKKSYINIINDYKHLQGIRVSSINDKNLFWEEQAEAIVTRCSGHVAGKTRFAQIIDEEQERELEQEQEQERQVSRPGPRKAAEHAILEPRLINLVKNGAENIVELSSWLKPLSGALQNTKLWNKVRNQSWGQNQVFVTHDFIKTVTGDGLDSYLRPVNWILIIEIKTNIIAIIISPFEANELIVKCEASKNAALCMFAARVSINQDQLLSNEGLTVSERQWDIKNFKNYGRVNADIMVMGGSLYFGDKEEQEQYVGVVGYVPEPRDEKEKLAVERRWTTMNGYLRSERRREVVGNARAMLCGFETEDPRQVVYGIVERRNYVTVHSHIDSIFVRRWKPF